MQHGQRVKLASPYGLLRRVGGYCSLLIYNEAEGMVVEPEDSNGDIVVRFDNLPGVQVWVPQHWLAVISDGENNHEPT